MEICSLRCAVDAVSVESGHQMQACCPGIDLYLMLVYCCEYSCLFEEAICSETTVPEKETGMKNKIIPIAAGLFGLLVFLLVGSTGCTHKDASRPYPVKRISKEQLREQLARPDIVIIDVRSKRDWENSDKKIPGSIYKSPPLSSAAWAAVYPADQPIVLYCA